MADTKPAVLGATAFKPVERHGWEAVRYLIHNPETGEFFTRTPKSWALITVFYLIYYSLLACFWAAMLTIFLQTIPNVEDKAGPRWTTDYSIIGVSPGLGLKPGQTPEKIDSSMIQYNKDKDADGNLDGYQTWVDRAKDFIDQVNKKQENVALETCSTSKGASAEKACKFDTTQLGTCTDPLAAYKAGSPCVYLKLNKIYDLTPTPYTKAEVAKLTDEDDMPQSLRDHINAQSDDSQVWVECHGENPADVEALAGKIKYYPETQGYPSYYFPYLQQDGYVSPVVAVQFENVPVNQLIHIECRAWALNIGYNRRDRIGINHLEIMVMDNDGESSVAAGSS